MTAEEQATWVQHAESITVRRLRDEVARAMDLRSEGRMAAVACDAEWREWLRREPGRSRERVRRLCELADATQEQGHDVGGHHDPDVFRVRNERVALRLKLPRELASQFLALTAFPGLSSMLLEFVETWDASPKRASDRVYIRDGWRCTAPGCRSMRNLEDHHIRYRSRGGDDSLRNRTCLCRFHHQQGEHGGLMRVTGTAPERLVWVMGKGGCGGAFRSDRAI